MMRGLFDGGRGMYIPSCISHQSALPKCLVNRLVSQQSTGFEEVLEGLRSKALPHFSPPLHIRYCFPALNGS